MLRLLKYELFEIVELFDEEQAFQTYRQKHLERQNNRNGQARSGRYSATLQRSSAGLCGGSISSPLSGESTEEEMKGKEHERLRGIKSNFSRLVRPFSIPDDSFIEFREFNVL